MTGIFEKAKVKSWSIGFLCCIAFAFFGCAQAIIVSADTEPKNVHISSNANWGCWDSYSTCRCKRWLTGKEKRSEEVLLPDFTFEKEGYFTYTHPSTRISIPRLTKRQDIFDFQIDKVFLKKDPAFKGSTTNPNKIELEVNSEPPGARVYEGGRLIGTTPFTTTYTLEPKHYEAGLMLTIPLVAAKEGCIPKEHKLTFEIDPEWRYLLRKTFEEGTVFLLQSNPNYKPPPQPVAIEPKRQDTQRTHLTIKQEDSFLDETLKFMQIMSIGKTLRPVMKP